VRIPGPVLAGYTSVKAMVQLRRPPGPVFPVSYQVNWEIRTLDLTAGGTWEGRSSRLPAATPHRAYRRLGSVAPATELNQRSQTANSYAR